MANKSIGNHPSHKGQVVEQIDTTGKQLSQGDSGKVFMVTHSSAVTINLPKVSAGIAGWNAKFVTKTSGAAFSLLAWGLPVAGGTAASTNNADTVIIKEMATTDAGAATATGQDGVTLASGATAGDSLDVFTDGTSWYVTASVADAAHSAAIAS